MRLGRGKQVSSFLRRSRALLFLALLSFTPTTEGKSTVTADSLVDDSSNVNSSKDASILEDSQEALTMTNIEIKCATHEIRVRIPTPHPDFSGMVYPQVTEHNTCAYLIIPFNNYKKTNIYFPLCKYRCIKKMSSMSEKTAC